MFLAVRSKEGKYFETQNQINIFIWNGSQSQKLQQYI